MLGGALRGFNLLLVLAGLLVGALIMQWRWSRRSIDAMGVQRRLPTEAFAGRPFRVRYRLHNRSRFMPVWMIRAEDRIQSVDRNLEAKAVCGAGVVAAGRTVVMSCECLVLRRGRYRFGPMQLITTFPFSLFTSQKTVESRVEFLVYPKILSLSGRWRQRLRSRTGGVATTARRNGPVEGDFFGLREWQTGDSPKWIHWRTSARINDLAVRQFEQQRRFDTCVLVDAFSSGAADRDATEAAISLAATFLVHLVGSPSNQVVLAIAGKTSDVVVGGGSVHGKRRMLGLLADAVSGPAPRLAEAAGKAMRMVGYTQEMVIISPRSMRSVKSEDPDFLKAVSPWIRRGSLRWIDVSTELEQWVVEDMSAKESGLQSPLGEFTSKTGAT